MALKNILSEESMNNIFPNSFLHTFHDDYRGSYRSLDLVVGDPGSLPLPYIE